MKPGILFTRIIVHAHDFQSERVAFAHLVLPDTTYLVYPWPSQTWRVTGQPAAPSAQDWAG